jgi:hypothetical protein
MEYVVYSFVIRIQHSVQWYFFGPGDFDNSIVLNRNSIQISHY